jgi:hypothetical protein
LARFDDVESLVAAAQVPVREALARHWLAGNPVAVWRHGKVVLIPPEEIPVDAALAAKAKPAAGG